MPPKSLALAATLALCSYQTLQAQSGPTVIFDDTFDVGAAPTFSNDADAPTDILWSRNSSTSFTAALSNDTGGPLAATGNSALLTLTGSSTNQFKELFTTYTELSLAVGEKLESRFTLRIVSPTPLPNKNDQIRVVLGNITGTGTVGTGYAVEIGTGPSTASTQFKYRAGSAAGSGGTNFLGTHTFYGINDFLSHDVIFSITRTSNTEVTLSYQLDTNPAVSVLTTTGVVSGTPSAFDRFGITAAQGPFAYRIDNLQLVKSSADPADTDSDNLDDSWEIVNFGSLTAQDGSGDPDSDTFTNEQEETAGSNPNNPLSTPNDKDADGLPDAWEILHFGNLNQTGNGDPDGDLATNAAEFAANTDPSGTDGLLSWPDTDTDTLNDAWEVLYFGAINAANAIPAANPDGDAFTNKDENDALSNPLLAASIPGDVDGDGLADAWEIANFTNLAQTGTGDFDNDRATNEQEETAGSNPKLNTSWPDADGDLLNDAWEIFYFGSITAQDGTGDPDGDTFSNDIEHTFGFNPLDPFSSPDLDADLLADGWELFYFGSITAQDGTGNPDGDAFTNAQEFAARSNPTLAASIPGDLDGDGLNDAWETFYFGNTTTATSPTTDNDGDGATNAQEFAAGSNPNLLASTPADTDGNGTPDSAYPIKPYTVDADTLHLWHLDETSAPFANAVNTAHNLQGLLNSATAWNGSLPGFGTGVNTNSGTTPNFGIVTYAPALDSAVTGDTATPASPAFTWQGADGSFTLEALVKFDSLPTTWTNPTMGEIICMEGDGSLTQDRVFQFRIDTSNAAAPTLQFQRLNTTTQSIAAPIPLIGDHAVDTTSWFHVAVTYDGNAGTAGNMKLYWTKVVPGASSNLLGSGSLTTDFPTGVQGDLSLGNEARAGGGSTEPFRGTIDEVRISSIARASTGFLFPATAPAAPAGLSATAGVNSVALSWTASPGAATYTIKRSAVAGGTPPGTYTTLSAGVVAGTNYTDNTALNGITYYYVVSAVGTGESPNSTEVSATPRSAFQTWALANGLTLGINDGPTQDPENDGLANLLEYATGTTNNPLAATTNPVTITTIINASTNRVLRLDFPRVNDPALTYVVQATNDLATAFVDVATYPAASTPVQHEDSVTLAPGVRRFLRLEIRQN